MKKLILIPILFIILNINGQSSENSKLEFIDVDILNKNLIKSDFVSDFTFSLDYDAILTLDVSLLPTLKKMDPMYFEKADVSEYKKKKKFRYDFSSNVNFKDIKTLFLNEKLLQKITKGKIDFSELDNRIYIKNNRIAIFTTFSSSSGDTSSSTYKCNLINGKIYFELISSMIDCGFGLPSEMQFESDSLELQVPK
jgi:hypothetical protein